nr:hypothetical protein [Tanacetum cinerariifolium]
MDMTIDQQVALDEALVPHASRLRIEKSNFHLRSDITSKESTLKVVYDVLRLTPFYKAFLVTADVPEIYMQEFWATTTVHHHSIRFKMNNKKCIVNLEYFREMMRICLRIPNQTFDELPFEEEILAFLRYLGDSGEIKKITDVNINKLHQPWRSFSIVINKCLSGNCTGYNSLRLSQAQILWGMYHKKNIDIAYLMWEDFVYQVELKDAKKSNEMYYLRFIKVIINFFMTKDPSIPKRNKVNWHYVRDDQMFTMIKLFSRHQNTQQFDAMLPFEITNKDIRNSAAYKEYYTIASGAAPPKTKVSVRKTQSSFDTTMPPPMAAGTRLSTSKKGKQPTKSSKAKDLENDGDKFVHQKLSTRDEEAKDEEIFVPIVQTPSQVENPDDESNDDESHGMNVRGDEGTNAEDDDEELYRDVNINLEGRDIQMTDFHITQVLEDTHVTLTPVNPAVQQAPAPIPTTAPSSSLQDLPNFGSLFGFEHRLKTLEANFSEFMQTNQFAEAISSILVTLKRRRDDADKDEEPSVGSDRGSKRRREGKEPESTSAPKEKASKTTNRSWNKTLLATHERIQPWISDLAKQVDSRTSFNELIDTPVDFLAFLINRLKVDTLTLELLVGLTYELMNGSCKSLVELEFFLEEVYKATTDKLDWNNSEG